VYPRHARRVRLRPDGAVDHRIASEQMSQYKIGALLADGTFSEFRHPDVYDIEQTTGPTRLVIAPSGNHVQLLLELARCWQGSYYLLYVLRMSGAGHEAGRYQSPHLLDVGELAVFLSQYRDFLEGDCRHALWIGSPGGEGTLVYDHHNVLFGYGPLEAYKRVLDRRGLRRGSVRIPNPHSHPYHADYDAMERRLLAQWDWIHSPLRDGDDEGM
jgi:hypothetical protein